MPRDPGATKNGDGRVFPFTAELRRLLASGDLGRPLQIEANFSQDKFLDMPSDNWRLSAAEAPGGPLTATGIHLVDLAVSVFGQPERAFASVRQLGSHLVNGDTLGALRPRRRAAAARDSACGRRAGQSRGVRGGRAGRRTLPRAA